MKKFYISGFMFVSLSALICGCSSSTTDSVVSTDTIDTMSIEEIVEESVTIDTSKVLLVDEEEKDIELKFLNVGDYNSTIVIGENKEVMLFDVGSEGSSELILKELQGYNIRSIDAIFLTELDEYTFIEVQNILNAYDIQTIYVTERIEEMEYYSSFIDNMPTLHLEEYSVGNVYNIGNVFVDVIYESIEGESVSFKLTYGDIDTLLLGDLVLSEDSLILIEDIESEIFRLGDSGSSASNTEEMIDIINPMVSVISVGDSDELPEEEVLNILQNKGIQYYCTDDYGVITIEVDGKNMITNTSEMDKTDNFLAYRTVLFEPDVAVVTLVDEETVVNSVTNTTEEENCE